MKPAAKRRTPADGLGERVLLGLPWKQPDARTDCRDSLFCNAVWRGRVSLYPYLSICTSLFLYLSICTVLFLYLSICTALFLYLFICTSLFPYLSICTSFSLHLCLSLCTSLSLCSSLSTSLYLFLSANVSLSFYLCVGPLSVFLYLFTSLNLCLHLLPYLSLSLTPPLSPPSLSTYNIYLYFSVFSTISLIHPPSLWSTIFQMHLIYLSLSRSRRPEVALLSL